VTVHLVVHHRRERDVLEECGDRLGSGGGDEIVFGLGDVLGDLDCVVADGAEAAGHPHRAVRGHLPAESPRTLDDHIKSFAFTESNARRRTPLRHASSGLIWFAMLQ
jgi:hypothetical protein